MNGNKLKAKFVEKGVSVAEVANLIGVNRSSLYRWLNNPQGIPIRVASLIKEALGLTDEEASAIFFD